MNKAERAIKACEEAADALEILPSELRKAGPLGFNYVSVESLRAQVVLLKNFTAVWAETQQPAEIKDT